MAEFDIVQNGVTSNSLNCFIQGGTTSGAWQCMTCMQWVPWGQFHACPSLSPVTTTTQNYPYYIYWSPNQMDKTAKAIEIVKKLREKGMLKVDTVEKFLEAVAEVVALM